MAGRKQVTRAESREGPTALDLIEEATHLVRGVPASCAATYMLGVVPFLLGLAFFVAEMSRGAHAAARLPGAACALVAAFAWMKAWQAVSAEHALAYLEQRAPAAVGWRAWIQLAAHQLSIHAWGLVLLPAAAVFVIPSGWVYAYFQNVTVLGLGERERTHRHALEQARLWPAQNHGALGALSVLGLLVVGNVGAAIYTVPWLVRTLTGTERVFAQTGWNPLNTTFLASTLALSFLVLDPVLKAFYVLRCFHGRSRRTGVDLLVQVRRAAVRSVGPALALVLLAGAFAVPAAAAASDTAAGPAVETAPVAPPPVLDPEGLDAALDRVLLHPEYAWREPAPPTAGALADFARWLRDLARTLAEWWESWIGGDEEEETRVGWGGLFGLSSNMLIWIVALLAVGLIIAVILSIVRRAGAAPAAVGVVQAAPLVLEREDVTADQLAETEWMRLARELIARGEIRLGMRALFLGSLAGLAERGLVVLARHKSNRDYERELARRGLPLHAVVRAFEQNRRDFERVWYGQSLPDGDTLSRFETNVRLLAGKGGAS